MHALPCDCTPAAGPPPRGFIVRPADVRLPPPVPPAPPGGPDGDLQQHEQQHEQRKAVAGAVISGKSTVVALPRAHEDKRGALLWEGLVGRVVVGGGMGWR